MGGGRRPGVGWASVGVDVEQASAGRVSTGGRTTGGRAPERRGRRRAGECRPERAPKATQRAGEHRKGDPVRQPWMERPHRDALKREGTAIRGAPVCSTSFVGEAGKTAER
jgi:hypothetical protein